MTSEPDIMLDDPRIRVRIYRNDEEKDAGQFRHITKRFHIDILNRDTISHLYRVVISERGFDGVAFEKREYKIPSCSSNETVRHKLSAFQEDRIYFIEGVIIDDRELVSLNFNCGQGSSKTKTNFSPCFIATATFEMKITCMLRF